MAQDYNQTLNLLNTEFPMRAGLPEREPVALEKWYSEELYEQIMKRNEGKPLYTLHDGPPYANGKIHLGTALNKILKDFVVRYKNMTGFNGKFCGACIECRCNVVFATGTFIASCWCVKA